jgi:ActR/RegA family two-component response regulator
MTTINYGEPALYRANPPRHRANWPSPTTADATMTAPPTITIVDDDPGIRESLEGLLRSVGLQVKALGSVPEFVKEGRPEGPTCLVLDVRLPGRRSGLDRSI